MRYEKPKVVVQKAKVNKNAPSVNPGDYCVIVTGGAIIVAAVYGATC
jgi:hypothetical protein